MRRMLTAILWFLETLLRRDSHRLVRHGRGCRISPECQHWQVTCGKMCMKRQDEETRTYSTVTAKEKGMGPGSAGQSGDTQGLSDVAEAGTESVEELLEEGQSFEAEVTSGVEEAPDPDVAEVHTRQVPEDDVPSEYLGSD